MSKLLQIFEKSRELDSKSVYVRLFSVEPNSKCLFSMSYWDDTDEPTMVWFYRDSRGQRVLSEDPDRDVAAGLQVFPAYVYPVYTRPGGWSVFVGTISRRSLLSNVINVLEAVGDPEAALEITRKGSGLDTEYFVVPATTTNPPERVAEFLKAKQESLRNMPSRSLSMQVVKRVLSRRSRNVGQDS